MLATLFKDEWHRVYYTDIYVLSA